MASGSANAAGSTLSKVTDSIEVVIFWPICVASVTVGSLTLPDGASNSLYSFSTVDTGTLPNCVSIVSSSPRCRPLDFSYQSVETSVPRVALIFQQSKPPKVPSPTVSTLSQRFTGSASRMKSASRTIVSSSPPSRSRVPEIRSCAQPTVPSKPVRMSPMPSKLMWVNILFGCEVIVCIGPLMPWPGSSIFPLTSIDWIFDHASRPPIAAVARSRIEAAVGSSVAGFAAAGAGAVAGVGACWASACAETRMAGAANASRSFVMFEIRQETGQKRPEGCGRAVRSLCRARGAMSGER